MEINLISDTVTKPTPEMLQYMFKAEVGDDVYRQDPTVNALQRMAASIFGMEDALFFPSGTMANQVAIKLHTQPGDELIADKWSHVYLYEAGGAAFHSGVSAKLLDGHRGMITAGQVAENITSPEFYHSPPTRLVCVENTTNRGGGACYDLSELKAIAEVCNRNDLKFHLDGARIWNALVAKRDNPKTYGDVFDTISVCLSKGLGAPLGSLLLGNRESIQRALRLRKILGGGMRQVGYMAAAGIYALQHHVSRLSEDHRRARELAAVLSQKPWVKEVAPVETNIVIFALQADRNQKHFIEQLRQKNIHISALGQGTLRMVTHLDYREVMHSYVLETLQKLV